MPSWPTRCSPRWKSPAYSLGWPKVVALWLAMNPPGFLELKALKISAISSSRVRLPRLNFFATRRSNCLKLAPRAEL
jgi:hypothetical protein